MGWVGRICQNDVTLPIDLHRIAHRNTAGSLERIHLLLYHVVPQYRQPALLHDVLCHGQAHDPHSQETDLLNHFFIVSVSNNQFYSLTPWTAANPTSRLKSILPIKWSYHYGIYTAFYLVCQVLQNMLIASFPRHFFRRYTPAGAHSLSLTHFSPRDMLKKMILNGDCRHGKA